MRMAYMKARRRVVLSAAALLTASVAFASTQVVADEIIADDLIVGFGVGGALCVGEDCVEDMDLGFSSIQVQGRTPRLQFEDTSADGSRSDWQIIANDPREHGRSYFGIAELRRLGHGRSTQVHETIIFRIDPGAPFDSLVVDSGGTIGVGTDQPAEQLDVAGDARVNGRITAVAFELPSSRALKHDIHEILPETALDVVRGLRPVEYRLVDDPDDAMLGFIAEEVPDLVASPGRETIDPMKIVATLARAAQAQGAAIEQRKSAMATLDARLERLERALAARSPDPAR